MHSPRLWLFDLDDTLHDASHAIFPAIHVNMNRFIEKTLRDAGLPCTNADVDAIRHGYWKRYGATLLGMIRHHRVRPADFLDAAHAFDDLPSMIRTERGIARMLERLPGKKILLTNAPRRYAGNVLRHIRLHRHFSKRVSIESMQVHGRLCPKPSRLLLRKLLAREGIAAHRCMLVDDTWATLKAAKAVGLRTVLVTGYHAPSRTVPDTAGLRAGAAPMPVPGGLPACTSATGLSGKPVAQTVDLPVKPGTRFRRRSGVDVQVRTIRELARRFRCKPVPLGKK